MSHSVLMSIYFQHDSFYFVIKPHKNQNLSLILQPNMDIHHHILNYKNYNLALIMHLIYNLSMFLFLIQLLTYPMQPKHNNYRMLLIVYLISLIHPILKNLSHLIFCNDLFLFLIIFLLFFQVILTFNIFYDPPSFLIILKNSYMQILDIDLLYKLNFNYLYN